VSTPSSQLTSLHSFFHSSETYPPCMWTYETLMCCTDYCSACWKKTFSSRLTAPRLLMWIYCPLTFTVGFRLLSAVSTFAFTSIATYPVQQKIPSVGSCPWSLTVFSSPDFFYYKSWSHPTPFLVCPSVGCYTVRLLVYTLCYTCAPFAILTRVYRTNSHSGYSSFWTHALWAETRSPSVIPLSGVDSWLLCKLGYVRIGKINPDLWGRFRQGSYL
jgi:hypothetical protein